MTGLILGNKTLLSNKTSLFIQLNFNLILIHLI